MEFSRQEHWSELPFFSPENLPDPGIELTSSSWAGKFFTTVPPGMQVFPESMKSRFRETMSVSFSFPNFPNNCFAYEREGERKT